MWKAIRREWDRLLVHLLLFCFGVYSVASPILSVRRSVPPWTELMFNVEFMIAGAVLFLGTLLRRSQWRRLGYGVAFIGLTTVALLIFLAGGARVGAYSLLILAFAVEFIVGLRRINYQPLTEDQLRTMMIRIATKDIDQEER